MPDISITAGNVVPASTANREQRTAGTTIGAGQVVYIREADGVALLADSDASLAAAAAVGVAANSAAAGQPITVITSGDVAYGSLFTVGEIYVASDTAGGIMPEGDLESGDYVTILGIGVSATTIRIRPFASGVQVPA